MTKRNKIQFTLNFLVDVISLLLSTALAWVLVDRVFRTLLPYTQREHRQFLLVLGVAFLLSFMGFNRADALTRRTARAELLDCVRSDVMLGAALATMMLLTKTTMQESRYLYVGILALNLLLLFGLRTGLKIYLNRYFSRGNMASLVGVVTTADRADSLLHDLGGDWAKKLQGVALVDENRTGDLVQGVPVVAGFDDLIDWIRREPLDEVYINVPYDTGESLRFMLRELESMGLTVHFNIPLLEDDPAAPADRRWSPRLQQGVETAGGAAFVTIATSEHSFGDMVVKRCMDIVISLIGLVVSAPIIAVVAVPLKLESPGPLFFKQKRVGLNGRVFYIYKLRSMYRDAEARKKELMGQNKMQGLMFKMDDDPRITRVGRFIRRTSIDELPQFWNVLRGDMSLVGTRPPTMDEYDRYQSHHKRRLSMKPGITGLWQVSGRSNIDNFEEVVKLDVAYIDHWSLALDAKILFKTVGVVLHRTGAE